jgi:uncharacterized protein YegL
MSVFKTGVNNAKLNIIFILDSSGSMRGARIGQLNLGVRDCLNMISHMDGLEEVNVEIRILQFDEDVRWVLGNEESGVTPEEALNTFRDIDAVNAITCTHMAVNKTMECLKSIYASGGNNYMPILILVTDGRSTYPEETVKSCVDLSKVLHGHTHRDEERTIRISIGVEEANRDELLAFASKRTIVHSDGLQEADVPNIFEVDSVENLRDVLKNITMASISNSISASSSETGQVIEYEDDMGEADDDEDDGIWEDL